MKTDAAFEYAYEVCVDNLHVLVKAYGQNIPNSRVADLEHAIALLAKTYQMVQHDLTYCICAEAKTRMCTVEQLRAARYH